MMLMDAMPREIDGKRFWTLAEAAHKLGGVSSKTLGNWIKRKIVSEPPVVNHGIREYYQFTDRWIAKAREEIELYRKQKAAARGRR